VPENLIARSSVAWATVLIWHSATARTQLNISHYTVFSLWLNVKWAQFAHATLLLAIKFSGTLYYNMHIASQEYSMFFTDYYVVIYESHGTTVLKWHYVEMQVYAALNSVQIYIYRNIWTVAFRQWWGLFPTGLGFVSIYLIECAMYCKSASLIHVYITSTLYEHVAIIDSFLSV